MLIVGSIFTGDVVEGAVWSVTGEQDLLGTKGEADCRTDTEVGEDLNDAYGLMEGLGQVYAVSKFLTKEKWKAMLTNR